MMEQNGVGRSSATEILRRLLDERGVEHTDAEDGHTQHTWWSDGDHEIAACNSGERLSVYNLTPEQAIAATLGSVSEKDSEKDSDGRGECHNDGDQKDFLCSECGARMYTDTGETYTMIDSLGNIIEQPKFCPMCGRKVVSE